MLDQIPRSPLPGALPTASTVTSTPPTSMFQTWRMALTKPRPATYAAIAHSPQASVKAAFGWIFGSAILASAIEGLAAWWNPAPAADSTSIDCGGVGAGIAAVAGFILSSGITHLLARALGGRATYGQLSYAIAAIQAPATVIMAAMGLLSDIPAVGVVFAVLMILGGFYSGVLEVTAVMGVHELSTVRSFFASCAVPIFILGCIAAVALLIVVSGGAGIGDIFSGTGTLP